MRNKISDLETFVAVVEAGSFTQAAERDGRSKAGVSRQIKALEKRLGVRLLNRTTRSLSLTDAGVRLYEGAAPALATLREAEAAASRQQLVPEGRLKVSLPMAFGSRAAAPPLLRLACEHPGLELDLRFSDRYVDLVAEGFDLAVRVGALADSSMIARRLCTTRRIVCASPSYLEAREPPTRPSDLRDHECLRYSEQVGGSAWRFAGAVTVNVSGRVQADSGTALFDAAVAGLGVTWLPDFYLDEALADGRLVPLLEEHEADALSVSAIYPARSHASLKLLLALEALSAGLATRR